MPTGLEVYIIAIHSSTWQSVTDDDRSTTPVHSELGLVTYAEGSETSHHSTKRKRLKIIITSVCEAL